MIQLTIVTLRSLPGHCSFHLTDGRRACLLSAVWQSVCLSICGIAQTKVIVLTDFDYLFAMMGCAEGTCDYISWHSRFFKI